MTNIQEQNTNIQEQYRIEINIEQEQFQTNASCSRTTANNATERKRKSRESLTSEQRVDIQYQDRIRKSQVTELLTETNRSNSKQLQILHKEKEIQEKH